MKIKEILVLTLSFCLSINLIAQKKSMDGFGGIVIGKSTSNDLNKLLKNKEILTHDSQENLLEPSDYSFYIYYNYCEGYPIYDRIDNTSSSIVNRKKKATSDSIKCNKFLNSAIIRIDPNIDLKDVTINHLSLGGFELYHTRFVLFKDTVILIETYIKYGSSENSRMNTLDYFQEYYSIQLMEPDSIHYNMTKIKLVEDTKCSISTKILEDEPFHIKFRVKKNLSSNLNELYTRVKEEFITDWCDSEQNEYKQVYKYYYDLRFSKITIEEINKIMLIRVLRDDLEKKKLEEMRKGF
jgi:hypothetical protein